MGENGSDVYVYWDTSGRICCCGCGMRNNDGSEWFEKRSLVVEHLRLHVLVGHYVPMHVFEDLRDEIETVGDEVLNQQVAALAHRRGRDDG